MSPDLFKRRAAVVVAVVFICLASAARSPLFVGVLAGLLGVAAWPEDESAALDAGRMDGEKE